MDVQQRLAEVQQQDLYRRRCIIDSAQGVDLCVEGKALINFSSNNYLGMANDPRVIKAFVKATKRYGVGSGASQLITGYQRPHYELEEALADFLNRDKVLLFSNGYMANLAIQQTYTNKDSLVILDRLNHASIIDGARLSGAKIKRYPHLAIEQIHQIANQYSSKDKMIISESVFSMDGDVADLQGLDKIAKQINGTLVIDDAHGFGVLGKEGRGVLDEENNQGCNVDLYLATLGKAVGVYGAFVAGIEDYIKYLLQKSRTLIYSTAIPAALAAASLVSLNIIEAEPWRKQRLMELVNYFKTRAKQMDLPVTNSSTPIQPIIIGDNKKTLELSKKLKQQGFLVQAIRPPTVQKNTARLRITFSVEHTESQIDRLLELLADNLAAV